VYLPENWIGFDETWQIDGNSGKSEGVEVSAESLDDFRLAALKSV